jgi:hypothetical protein
MSTKAAIVSPNYMAIVLANFNFLFWAYSYSKICLLVRSEGELSPLTVMRARLRSRMAFIKAADSDGSRKIYSSHKLRPDHHAYYPLYDRPPRLGNWRNGTVLCRSLPFWCREGFTDDSALSGAGMFLICFHRVTSLMSRTT